MDVRRQQEYAVKEELRRVAANANKKLSGGESIPPKMRTFSFASYSLAIRRNFGDGDQSKADALDVCREYSRNFHVEFNGQSIYNLILTGSVGTGKTGLSVPILKAGIECGMSCGYIDFTVFMSQCHSSELAEKERSILNISRVDLLAIDDLGTAERSANGMLKPESNDAIRIATQILNTRIQRMLPTLITSNLDIDGLATQFGDRLASRLVESSMMIWVGGRDMRLDNLPTSGKTKL